MLLLAAIRAASLALLAAHAAAAVPPAQLMLAYYSGVGSSVRVASLARARVLSAGAIENENERVQRATAARMVTSRRRAMSRSGSLQSIRLSTR